MPDGVAASFEARGLVATAAGGLTGVTTLVELSHLIASPPGEIKIVRKPGRRSAVSSVTCAGDESVARQSDLASERRGVTIKA